MKKITFFILIFKLSLLNSMCLEKNKFKFNIDKLIQQTLDATTFDQILDLTAIQTKLAIYLTQNISFRNHIKKTAEEGDIRIKIYDESDSNLKLKIISELIASPIEDSFLNPKITSWQEWDKYQLIGGPDAANYKSKTLPCFDFYQGNRENISPSLNTQIKKFELELRIKYNKNLSPNGYIDRKQAWFNLLITNLEKINYFKMSGIFNDIPHLHAVLINHFINDLTVTPIINANLEKDGELVFCKKILQMNFLGLHNILTINKEYQLDDTQNKEPIIPTKLPITTKNFLLDKYQINTQSIEFFDGIELD